jgi:hypothetical protein
MIYKLSKGMAPRPPSPTASLLIEIDKEQETETKTEQTKMEKEKTEKGKKKETERVYWAYRITDLGGLTSAKGFMVWSLDVLWISLDVPSPATTWERANTVSSQSPGLDKNTSNHGDTVMNSLMLLRSNDST